METAQEGLQNQYTIVTKVSQGSVWQSILLRDQAWSWAKCSILAIGVMWRLQ